VCTIGWLCNVEPMTGIAAVPLNASCKGETKGSFSTGLISLWESMTLRFLVSDRKADVC